MTTELIKAGELSNALSSRLQEAGKRISEDHLRTQIETVERRRTLFQVDCLILGVMLLAKKQELSHGKFLPWFKRNLKMADSAIFNEDGTLISYRTARVYMQLAKRFLHNLEQGKFEGDFADERIRLGSLDRLENLPSLQVTEREGLETRLGEFIAGRSLDRMLKDFRQAEKDADNDFADQADSSAASGGDEDQTIPPEQLVLDFIQEWDRHITSAEKLLWDNHMDPRIAHLKRRDYEDLLTRLNDQAARLRNIIKEMAE